MTSLRRNTWIIAAIVALACGEISAPDRSDHYEWRLVVNYDSLGPRLDTLSFHWPRSSLPVRIWVEDAEELPASVSRGIGLWKGALLYGEWDARLVSDSLTADIVVRLGPSPGPVPPPVLARLRSALLPQCDGVTEIDTVSTRFELSLPLHVFINPLSLPGDPDLPRCLNVTVAHELGHSIGVFQHSPDANDLMFAQPAVDPLSRRDMNTIQVIYHYPANMVPVRP